MRAVQTIFAHIRSTLLRLGIHFDVYYNELDLYETGKVNAAVQALASSGYAYQKDGATWLRAHDLGLKQDRVIIKSSGEPTYRMPDIAYHLDKIHAASITWWTSSARITMPPGPTCWPACAPWATTPLGSRSSSINSLPSSATARRSRCPPVAASSSPSTTCWTDVTTESIPGKDVLRFTLLTRSPDSSMTFDLDLAVKESSENPVYYVHTATHASNRSCQGRRRKLCA